MAYILGISAYFHDSACCLLKDGHIVAAAQEERFSRIKNDAAFPAQAIRFCLDFAQINLTDVTHIVFYEKPFLKFERLLETYLSFAPAGALSFLKSMPVWLKGKLFIKKNIGIALQEIDPAWKAGKDILFSGHHQSHAASAFFPSPFDEAVILTVDGVGEWATTTVSIGKANRMDLQNEIRFPHSLGLLYAAFTAYLGFKVNCDEYKVMGLAAYGEPCYTALIYQHLLDVKPDGSFCMDMKFFNYGTGLSMTNKKFDRLFGRASRKSGEEVSSFHKDIAASIQKVTEEVMLLLTRHLQQQYQVDNLCFAGGVALNCVVNSVLLKQSGFKNIWIQPAAGDAGGAIGAAYSVHYEHLGNQRMGVATDHGQGIAKMDSMQNALLGPEFSADQIQKVLLAENLSFSQPSKTDFYKQIAQYLAEGKIVGYFNGKMEFGPRALGCRSILADPRNPEMQTILNQKIKLREGFRPFAPAILEEFAADYFEGPAKSPYMLFVSDCINTDIPAVTHIDGTARVQTVHQEAHPDFYALIYAFYSLTGCPLVINTSFNVMDEPIVCSPADAVRSFRQTNIDVLAIGGHIVTKK